MKLKDRIRKIELMHNTREHSGVDLICIEILSADPDERIANTLYRIEGGGSKWVRMVDETEDVFIERALSAARALRPGVWTVCLGFPNLELMTR